VIEPVQVHVGEELAGQIADRDATSTTIDHGILLERIERKIK